MITRNIEKHLNLSDVELEVIVESVIPKKGDGFIDAYHCCACGVIYSDKDYKTPIMDLLLLTGKTTGLGKPFLSRNISSGYCTPCYDIISLSE